nr:bradyzoite surface protein BSR4 [Neospora caninum]ABQ43783.1 bradyzoite surface protein BSR4 precursor [Neospora caninum]
MARSGSIRQRHGGLGSKARKLAAVGVVGVLLFSRGQAVADDLHEGLQNRGLQAQQKVTTVALSVTGTTAKCAFPATREAGEPGEADTAPASGSVTLSKGILTATLQCSSQSAETLSTIPTNLAHKVCGPKQGHSPEAGSCTVTGSSLVGTETELKQLLGTTREIKWIKDQSPDVRPNTQWSLALQESDLPLSEKTFFVGCQQTQTQNKKGSAQTKSTCTVTVNVEARASSVGENNVVTCAYGKNSNPKPLEVDMTTANNTLTIDCGSEGSLNPASYETQFCDPQEKDLKNCAKKDYVDILPTFRTTWWTTENEGSSVKLTIPETEFPESEQQFRLGCVPVTTTSNGATNENNKLHEDEEGGAETVTSTSCNVLVTIKTSAASYASHTMQMLTAASGAAAVTGLIVGSL